MHQDVTVHWLSLFMQSRWLPQKSAGPTHTPLQKRKMYRPLLIILWATSLYIALLLRDISKFSSLWWHCSNVDNAVTAACKPQCAGKSEPRAHLRTGFSLPYLHSPPTVRRGKGEQCQGGLNQKKNKTSWHLGFTPSSCLSSPCILASQQCQVWHFETNLSMKFKKKMISVTLLHVRNVCGEVLKRCAPFKHLVCCQLVSHNGVLWWKLEGGMLWKLALIVVLCFLGRITFLLRSPRVAWKVQKQMVKELKTPSWSFTPTLSLSCHEHSSGLSTFFSFAYGTPYWGHAAACSHVQSVYILYCILPTLSRDWATTSSYFFICICTFKGIDYGWHLHLAVHCLWTLAFMSVSF